MLKLVLANLTRLLKDTKLIIGICMVPVFVTLVTSVFSSGGLAKPSLAIVNLERSESSEELIALLGRQYTVSQVSLEVARSDVENSFVSAAVVISGDAGVEVMRLVGYTDPRLEALINNHLNTRYLVSSSLPSVTIENDQVNESNPFALNFIINFMFYTAAMIIGEVNDLKRWRLLPRIFTTPNTSRQILGSVLMALFAILFIQFIAIAAASVLTDFNLLSNIAGSVLLFGSYIFFILSFGVLVGRFVSNSGMVPVVLNLVIAPLGIVSGTMIPRQFTPEYLTRLDFLTPQYWVYSGVEALNTASLTHIIPNVVILLLMGFCCFTAGAFRFRDLVE